MWGSVTLFSCFPACATDPYNTNTRIHIYITVDQLLLSSFYFIILFQISTSMNRCGLWSQSCGSWCFSTVGKLPPLLRKIETHTPDETLQDESQHETNQTSLSVRRRVIKQVQRKQFYCNLLYIRYFWANSENIQQLMWLQSTAVLAVCSSALYMTGMNILPWLGKIFDYTELIFPKMADCTHCESLQTTMSAKQMQCKAKEMQDLNCAICHWNLFSKFWPEGFLPILARRKTHKLK